MSDYILNMLENDHDNVISKNPDTVKPVTVWEVCFLCDVSPEGDMLDDSIDVHAYEDGLVAVEKVKSYVLSPKYLMDADAHVPTKFVLKGLRPLATAIL